METTKPQEDWNNPSPNQNYQNTPNDNKRVISGIMALLLGSLGIHKFILGYNNEGAIMLVVTVLGFIFSCFVIPMLGPIAMGVISFVEGIIYLTKSDEEFFHMYQINKRGWF